MTWLSLAIQIGYFAIGAVVARFYMHTEMTALVKAEHDPFRPGNEDRTVYEYLKDPDRPRICRADAPRTMGSYVRAAIAIGLIWPVAVIVVALGSVGSWLLFSGVRRQVQQHRKLARQREEDLAHWRAAAASADSGEAELGRLVLRNLGESVTEPANRRVPDHDEPPDWMQVEVARLRMQRKRVAERDAAAERAERFP